MYIQVCLHAYGMYVCVHVCICAYGVCACVCTWMWCVCASVLHTWCVYMCMYMWMYMMCVHVYTCSCMYVCIVYVYGVWVWAHDCHSSCVEIRDHLLGFLYPPRDLMIELCHQAYAANVFMSLILVSFFSLTLQSDEPLHVKCHHSDPTLLLGLTNLQIHVVKLVFLVQSSDHTRLL